MTPQELALHSWRQEKLNYEKNAQRVILDLSDSIQLLSSPSFQTKLEELKEYLRYNYTYEQEQNFVEVYVQLIAGKKNISVMELSNKLVEEVGGTPKFWQSKITDIAQYVTYHPQLSIWEVNSFYQQYLGLAPENMSHLRKKKALAKKYLTCITSICKIIDKAKSFEEDLLKIDQAYIKLKKASEDYYAFLDQIQNRTIDNMSLKAISNAKKNLFLFIKPKQQKMNTLMNYNFKCRRSHDKQLMKVLNEQETQQFEGVISKLRSQRKSQKFSVTTRQARKSQTSSMQQLRKQFKNRNKTPKNDIQKSEYAIYIWSRQFFFSYWGYIVKPSFEVDYTMPFKSYPSVNYEIDSEQQFDQFHAEDVDLNNSSSQMSMQQDQNSFLVSDLHQSDRQQQNRMKMLADNYFKDRWVKTAQQLANYQIISLSSTPLPLQEEQFCQQFADRISGMSREQIIECLKQQRQIYSKARLDFFLRTKFKKQRSKNKNIYIKLGSESKEKTTPSENESNTQAYEISISYASRPGISQVNESDETILEQSQANSNQLHP